MPAVDVRRRNGRTPTDDEPAPHAAAGPAREGPAAPGPERGGTAPSKPRIRPPARSTPHTPPPPPPRPPTPPPAPAPPLALARGAPPRRGLLVVALAAERGL